MSGGGGQSGGIEGYLPIAAALAATVMTDGAAAPLLEESLGTTGAAAVMGGGIGALAGGATAALTGQDVGRNALMGGLGGAMLGYGGMYSGAPEAGMSFSGAPLSGTNVAGTAAVNSANTAGIAAGSQAVPIGTQSALGIEGGTLGTITPQQLSAGVASGQIPIETANAYGQAYTNAFSGLPATVAPASTGMGLGTKVALGGLGLAALMQADNKKYGVPSPASQKYTGPLTKFKYDPNQYQPAVATPPNPAYQPEYPNYAANPFSAAQGGTVPGYAGGGLMDPNSEPVDFMGGDMYPQSQIQRSYYASPTQMPTSAQQTMASYEPKTNPLTGEPTAHMAAGGIAGAPSLGSYAAGGNPRLLKGPGDGMSDNIPATIGHKQPARLADGEFVVPADVVSHLGNGSTDAGAKRLYNMMDKVRKARTGTKKQGKEIKAEKYLPK